MPRHLAAVLAAVLVAGTLAAACGDDDAATEPATTTTTATTTAAATGTDTRAGTTEGALEVDGIERTYRLHVPDGIGDGPAPLVVALHGGGGSADQFAGENGLEELADEEQFVVVHPDGSEGGRLGLQTWNAGDCCGPAADGDVDDVGFVRALVEELGAELPIDPDRVYALGHSNGAMLSYRLACEAADVFAAIGSQAGALGVDTCAPAQPVAFLHVHGTADTNVPLEGGIGSGVAGVSFRSTIGSIETLVAAQGCDDEPVDAIDDANPDLSTSTWSCPGGAEVQLALVDSGAHGWFGGPRADRRDGPAGVDSTALIWTFLAAHPRT